MRKIIACLALILMLFIARPLSVLAVAYDVSSGTLSANTFDFGSETSGPRSMSFSNDGLKLYIGDWDGEIFQYTLTSAYDITTASYDSATYDLPEIGSSGLDEIVVSNDGTKLLALEFYDRRIYEYTMSTPYDITTTSYSSNSYYIGEGQNNYSFGANPDGSQLYVQSDYDDKIFQYTLSTPWDVSTMSYDTVSLDVPNFGDGQVLAMFISDNGENLYLETATNERLHWFVLGTAWDISTAVNQNSYYEFAGTDGWVTSMEMNADGSKMFVMGYINETIYELTLAAQSSSGSTTVHRPQTSVSSVESEWICGEGREVSVKLAQMEGSWDYRYTLEDRADSFSPWQSMAGGIKFIIPQSNEVTLFLQIKTSQNARQVFTQVLDKIEYDCDQIDDESTVENTDSDLQDIESIDPIVSGMFIKGASYDTVYYVTDELNRRPFSNEEILYSYIDSMDEVSIMSDATLTTLPLGDPMLPKAGSVLFRTDYSQDIYTLNEDGDLIVCGKQHCHGALQDSYWGTKFIYIPETLFVKLFVKQK